MGHERRRHTRYPSGANVMISADLPDGEEISAEGVCLNISQSGLLLKCEKRLPPDSLVSFKIDRWDLEGWATVRHCREVGGQFLAGVEFNDGLEWIPAELQGKARTPSIMPVLVVAMFCLVLFAIVVLATSAA